MTDIIDRSRLFAMVPYDIISTIENGNAIALYAVLKMYAGPNQNAHPSRKTLAKKLGYKTPRMVDAALDVLQHWGLVVTFPRFKDAEGNISRERSERFSEQTSNGYVIYDQIRRQDQLDFDVPHDTQVHTPTPIGAYPLHTEVHTPYTHSGHEGYSLEGDSSEGDISPCSPPEGDGSQGELIPTSQAPVPQKQSGASSYPQAFEDWWDLYPKKVGKQAALRAWRKACKVAGSGGLERALESHLPSMRTKETRFVPNPATWLNEGRYDDEPPAVQERPKSSSSDVMAWFTPAGGAPTSHSPTVVDAEVVEQRELGA